MKFSWVIFLIVVSCYTLQAQKLNQLNKNKQRTGKWINYSDSAKTTKLFEGRFKNGKAVGKAYYYLPSGLLDRTELTRFKKLKTAMYYPNGKLRQTGQARIDNLPDKIHYYFYGRWKYYDETGELIKYCYYKKGNLIRTVFLNPKAKAGDSLAKALYTLDTAFVRKNQYLISQIQKDATIPYRCESYREKLYKYDTLTFRAIETIIKKYDYPTKSLVGEANIIPFSIMSYASRSVREKYVPLFIKVAERGDLEWSSVAIFIDKARIAFGKEQVYGTQYNFDKRGRLVYFPIEDKDHLNERRNKIGLGDFKE